MERGFLGLPWAVWGVAALALALVWVVVWPTDRAAGASGLRLWLLRWGHALVWVLLGISFFVRGVGQEGAANVIALAALAVYLAFLGAIFMGG